MEGSVLTTLREILAIFGVSIEMAIFVIALTVMLSVSMLTGQAARIGVWLEDLLYRSGRCGG